MRYVAGFGRFWWDFIIGEDWRIAAGVAAVLGFGALLVATTELADSVITVGTGIALLLVVVVSIVVPAISSRRAGASKSQSA